MKTYIIQTNFSDILITADRYEVQRHLNPEDRLIFYENDCIKAALPLDQVEKWWEEGSEEILE